MMLINDKEPKGNVYFVQAGDGGPIKIGYAHSAKRRFRELQRFSPVKLILLAVRDAPPSAERAYHRLFRTHRLHGEWFTPHADILSEIAEIWQAPEQPPMPPERASIVEGPWRGPHFRYGTAWQARFCECSLAYSEESRFDLLRRHSPTPAYLQQ